MLPPVLKPAPQPPPAVQAKPRQPISSTAWIAGIGAVIFLIGAIYGLTVAIQRGWMSPSVRVGLVQEGDPLTHWPRVLANHGHRVEPLGLADFQTWAGPRSVLMSFVYGATSNQVFVLPAWLRVTGPDVRLQFRSLLGWRILDVPLEIYPRWLVAADAQTLTDLRPAA